MFSSIIAIGSLALLAAASPTDNPRAIINNKCPFGVSIWYTGAGPTFINAGNLYAEKLAGQSKTLLIEQGRHDKNDIYADVPKISFGYTVTGNRVFYDLETLSKGWPSHRVVLSSSDKSCKAVDFQNGVNPNGQDHTQSCAYPSDVTLTLCA